MSAKDAEREYKRTVAGLTHVTEEGHGTLLDSALSQLQSPKDLQKIALDMQRHNHNHHSDQLPLIKVRETQTPSSSMVRIEQDLPYSPNILIYEQKEDARRFSVKARDYNGDGGHGDRQGHSPLNPKKYQAYIDRLNELADHGDGVSLAKELNRLNIAEIMKVSRDLEARNAREKAQGIWAPTLKVSVSQSELGTRIKLCHDIRYRRDHVLVDIKRSGDENTVKGRRF